jgi:tetratricopeptide (TPR) repeat protein
VSDMKHEHLTRAALERFFSMTQLDEVNRLLLHLLAVCPECAAVGGKILAAYEAGAIGIQFSSVDIELFASRREADELWKILKLLPYEEQLRLVRTDARYMTWGLVELLSRESMAAGPHNPSQAVALALLAVEAAKRLKPWEPCEPEWLYELRAYAFAHLASAYRVSGDLMQAERVQRQADTWWRKGSRSMGDILGYEPVILSLKASLRKDERRFDEALSLLDEVAKIYLAGDPEIQDFHLAGRTFVKRAKVLEEMGDLDQALALLREASPLVDPAREPRLVLCVQHNLVDTLSKLGRPSEAKSILPKVRELSRTLGNDLDLVRLTWTEARIAEGLGEPDNAEQLYRSVREEFVSRGIAYDVALVSLELATLYARAGSFAEVKAVARDLVPLLEAQAVHREALAALAVFMQAALHERATADLVERVARYLAEARGNPALKFEGD